MSLYENKTCLRCKKIFECKPGNITQCQCYAIKLSVEQRAYIEQQHNDCLCCACLGCISAGLNLFKKKYIFR